MDYNNCHCDVFITDGRRPTHCHYCGGLKPKKTKDTGYIRLMCEDCSGLTPEGSRYCPWCGMKFINSEV